MLHQSPTGTAVGLAPRIFPSMASKNSSLFFPRRRRSHRWRRPQRRRKEGAPAQPLAPIRMVHFLSTKGNEEK
ncbi:hypothetical protein L596_006301 [Steinernema carpocapsae]|uniref:Uncharacterized protein n=1 Tax=Steinernema carpocapsae TaxID=34508 RepID=A0A4V6I8R0_STECR|nr:hypothetical protein L596_006301 [Steinernema carpocapsae]